MPDDQSVRLRKYFNDFSVANKLDVSHNRLIDQDGVEHEMEWTNQCVFDERGRFVEFQSVGRDATPRINMEKALKESQERFEDLTNMASDWVWELDTELRYSYLSENLKNHIGGASIDQFLGRSIHD